MPVHDTDVKAIIDTERDTTPFITAAQLVVTEELTGALPGLSSARMDLITTYLAAHFCAITDQSGGLLRSRIGDTEEDYLPISGYSKPNMGFKITRYGQQAMVLDTTGTLAAMSANAGMKALFRVMAQIDDPTWTGWMTQVSLQ